ncbi:hypothetical protein QFC21_001244 [Naganishia friedmannii]|uniref:Uncharacterized protein n=1 Tax=Naganishia friedmannii TaxID=89922 RepID=A0ACC2W3C4_9TREE|nr:hypothetical protein QFC21_001244 [Naganishia friedmannii]
MFKKRTRTANPREKVDLTTPPAEGEGSADQVDEQPTETLREILLLRKYSKQQAQSGIDVLKLNKGEEKKQKKKKKAEGEPVEEEEEEYGLQEAGKKAAADEEDEADPDDEESKLRKLVRSNNFTQQTNALDVDKHMMAFIETELAKRRGEQVDDDGAQKGPIDPQDELYKIAERYRLEQKQVQEEDEGNVTTSLGMLTSIPEVDLGMDHRLKNIEETERAKRAMMEAKRTTYKPTRQEQEENYATARFYRPNHQVQSDADALEDARRDAMGLPPLQRQRKDRNQTATDDQVYERFKKRYV